RVRNVGRSGSATARATNASIVGPPVVVLKLLYKKIEDCVATAVLNRLDVREGSQGDSHPSVYSFRHSSPRCFSPLLLSAPFPDIRGVEFFSCLPYLDAGVDVLGAGAVAFGAGAGAGAAGAGAGVASAGAGFTAAVLGADVVGAAE